MLDASALLAMLHTAPGAGGRTLIAGGLMSSVKWSEVVEKAVAGVSQASLVGE